MVLLSTSALALNGKFKMSSAINKGQCYAIIKENFDFGIWICGKTNSYICDEKYNI